MRANSPTSAHISATKGTKVFVGLSGGVDSAVSAALLQQRGYDVHGVFIRIALPGYPCSAGVDKVDAMRVAAHLKISFTEIDMSEEYEREVFKTSMREFERGRTPNPDALCNREIKFGLLYDWAMSEDADFIATGHYAQTKDGMLYAGADDNKDQSYFLWMVPEEKLRKTLFPVGHLQKPEVRALAKKFKLPNAERKDSQGLCFLGDISIDDMLQREITLTPGDVLNEVGEVIGSHEGVPAYTLGQRHGFTLFGQGPDAVPMYVIEKDVEFNTITVSPNKFPTDATKTDLTLSETNWIGEVKNGKYFARYRYRQELIPATKDVDGKVILCKPHYVPLGQSLVLYDGERCLGGGIIDRACLSS
jgi:tRNA-specific 2-thiouridylase